MGNLRLCFFPVETRQRTLREKSGQTRPSWQTHSQLGQGVIQVLSRQTVNNTLTNQAQRMKSDDVAVRSSAKRISHHRLE
jgi:hypothetical protein